MCRQMPVAPDPSAEFLSPFQRFNPSELALPVQPRRAGGERAAAAAAAVAPSLPPSHPPAGLRGRDGATPARCRERRRAAQRTRGGRPAAPRRSRSSSSSSSRDWAPGIGTRGFKSAGIRGARRGAGVPQLAPLTNRRCPALPLA